MRWRDPEDVWSVRRLLVLCIFLVTASAASNMTMYANKQYRRNVLSIAFFFANTHWNSQWIQFHYSKHSVLD